MRYADDCSIFLGSKRAANRVLGSITEFIEQKLGLKVNTEKTSICRPIDFHTLGYNFISTYKRNERGKYRLRVSSKRFKLVKEKVKEITRKTRSLSFNQRIAELNKYAPLVKKTSKTVGEKRQKIKKVKKHQKKDMYGTMNIIKTPYMESLITSGLAQQDLKHN